MLSAIAFLPPNDVIRGFEEFADCIWNVDNGYADDLLEYFEDTYIGRYLRNAPRRQPSFPIQLWTVSQNRQQIFPRKQQRRGMTQGFLRSHIIMSSEFLEIHQGPAKRRELDPGWHRPKYCQPSSPTTAKKILRL